VLLESWSVSVKSQRSATFAGRITATARWRCPRQSDAQRGPSPGYPGDSARWHRHSRSRKPSCSGRQKTGDGMAALVERRRPERPDFAGSERHRGRRHGHSGHTWRTATRHTRSSLRSPRRSPHSRRQRHSPVAETVATSHTGGPPNAGRTKQSPGDSRGVAGVKLGGLARGKQDVAGLQSTDATVSVDGAPAPLWGRRRGPAAAARQAERIANGSMLSSSNRPGEFPVVRAMEAVCSGLQATSPPRHAGVRRRRRPAR